MRRILGFPRSSTEDSEQLKKELDHYKRLFHDASQEIRACVDQLKSLLEGRGPGPRKPFVPSGHFYSPIPDLEEIRKREEEIFVPIDKNVSNINLREMEQVALVDRFVEFYSELPFPETKTSDRRYYFENAFFSYADAIVLYSLMRVAEPRRIIEVGSGFSSCAILDTNEVFFDNQIACTFIDPYPENLYPLLHKGDEGRVRILPKRVQEVPLHLFETLEAGDILFVDSSHVAKAGSDVNHILFGLLPLLQSGVYVHFHDIFFPFEYPKEWIYEGRAWNEAYVLRAFLQYNPAFQIVYFNHFMGLYRYDTIVERMPLCMKNTGGSLWLRKQ